MNQEDQKYAVTITFTAGFAFGSEQPTQLHYQNVAPERGILL